ncbi:hypothetical protein RBSWK_01353 [Rhodopirellula baltica SWK14]|uniref:Uncharacterized protein n=1 Tax=Rhodopirellula baltica SWK14 TaxID=993516 RepID=L7CP58_RHOBT|nr:hypothetical protein RBSWK_01353 [Rhodopirellula baltica SWK14]
MLRGWSMSVHPFVSGYQNGSNESLEQLPLLRADRPLSIREH